MEGGGGGGGLGCWAAHSKHALLCRRVCYGLVLWWSCDWVIDAVP